MRKYFSNILTSALLRPFRMHEVKLEHHLDNKRSLSHLVRDLILDVSDDFDDNKEKPTYHLLFHMPFIRSLTENM